MTEQQNQDNSQEKLENWVREQFQRANKHLAESGVLFDSVVTEESVYLAPFLAIWKIKSTDNKYYWVICGDVPCDFMPFEHEKTAREAIKHFSMVWQLKAEKIRQSGTTDQTQVEFAQLLEKKAESLYEVQSRDDLWQGY